MWTRKLSERMGGINQDDFVQAFVHALSNQSVIGKLQSAVCGSLQKEVCELRDLIKKKDDKISLLEDKISMLEQKQDDLEQYSRRNSLRVNGLEETPSEDIVDKVIDLFNNKIKVSPKISESEIDRVHRVGPKKEDSPRSVLIKFAVYGARNRVFRNKKNLKSINMARHGGDAPSVPELHGQENDSVHPRQKQSIFINEDLTRHRSHLLFLARQLKQQKKIEDCWTWDGTVLIKNKVSKIIPVKSEAELYRASQ